MLSKEEILSKVRHHLVDMFGVPLDAVVMEAQIYKDLDIDSIDAIDLLVVLEEYIEKKVDPNQFRNIRTIQDVVDTLYSLTEKN